MVEKKPAVARRLGLGHTPARVPLSLCRLHRYLPWHSATGHLTDHVFRFVEISVLGFNPTRPLFRSSKLTICSSSGSG
jgi:hypothetical protein